MGTDKRERQKANRQLRLEQLAKEQQKQKTKRRAIQIGGLIAAAVVLALLFFVFGNNKDSSSSTTTTLAADASTTTLPPVPTVSTMAPKPTVVPAAAITGATPCPAADGTSARVVAFAQEPPTCIDPAKKYAAAVDVEINGKPQSFTIDLDVAAAPKAINNFVTLARYHFYDGTVCFRAVPDFIVQCGSPTDTNSGTPGYKFADEKPASPSDYALGAVAMANSGPDTNGSQFFIVSGAKAATGLETSYSLFGHVAPENIPTAVAAMNALASPTEVPTGLIQIIKVTITES